MADTPNLGDPATPVTVPNDVTNAGVPTDNANGAELERLRKELAQKTMRENQLANELEQKRKAEEAIRQKNMEEKQEFKELYEQTQQRLNDLEQTAESERRSAQLKMAAEEVIKDYPDAVKELAKTAGLSLTDDSDEARKSLKEKLDTFKSKLAPSVPSMTPNNPRSPAPQQADRQSMVARSAPGQESPMALASARGDNSVTYSYIGSLPAIQRMREISQSS